MLRRSSSMVFWAAISILAFNGPLDASAQHHSAKRIQVVKPSRTSQPSVPRTQTGSSQSRSQSGFNFMDGDGDGFCDAYDSLMRDSQTGENHNHNGEGGNHGGAMGSGGDSGGMMGSGQGHSGGGMMGSGQGHSAGGMMGSGHNHSGGGMMGSGQDHSGDEIAASTMHFPALQEGQVFLCGTVTEVNGNLFTLLSGAFLVNATGVSIQSMPMHDMRMHESSNSSVSATLQAGQRVALLGQFEIKDNGKVFKPSRIQVMGNMHNMMDSGHGSVAGMLTAVDPVQKQLSIAGIPLLIGSQIVFRPAETILSDLKVGSQVMAQVRLVDSDGDNKVDVLSVERLTIPPMPNP